MSCNRIVCLGLFGCVCKNCEHTHAHIRGALRAQWDMYDKFQLQTSAQIQRAPRGLVFIRLCNFGSVNTHNNRFPRVSLSLFLSHSCYFPSLTNANGLCKIGCRPLCFHQLMQFFALRALAVSGGFVSFGISFPFVSLSGIFAPQRCSASGLVLRGDRYFARRDYTIVEVSSKSLVLCARHAYVHASPGYFYTTITRNAGWCVPQTHSLDYKMPWQKD